ncbi:MAG: DUF6029 family protein [Bacteroidia bacterium]|nr:DUF6029 family protein [Bacteroidia bacterium]
MINKHWFIVFCFFACLNAFSQNNNDATIHGNFEIDAQYYEPDSLIGAPRVPEKVLSNVFGNMVYEKDKFSAGVRYEAYNNVMQGFDKRYKGQGIVYRFARYKTDFVDITVGNIYEQFGSGLMFRTYYEPGLLYDNSLDGARAIITPHKGLTFKGMIGRQRNFFTLGEGIVRALDGELSINDLFDSLHWKTRFILGGSFVSKYQPDKDPDLILPENVGCYGGRINIINESINFFAEYAYKINDPSYVNGYNYKFGEALFTSFSYARKGFALILQAKRIDNMDFRSERDATLQQLLINYMPATTKQHTYLMPAFFPYATQPNGEVGGMAECQFKIPKNTFLGGAYGTDITVNFSFANGLKKHPVSDTSTTMNLYSTRWDEVGEQYYHDFFIEVQRKINKKWKMTAMYSNQFYNKNIVMFNSPNAGFPNMQAHIGVIDVTYKYKTHSAIRMELQERYAYHRDINGGSWAVGLLEWTPSSHFYLTLIDQFNYDNPDVNLRLHYYTIGLGFVKESNRISITYGKQRAGVFCVGGVCRNVPASNGLAISITSTF